MADVTPSALYPLIHDFLSENGLKKTLKAFKKEVDAAKLKKTDGAQSLMDIYKNSLKGNAAKKPHTNGKSKKASSSSSDSDSSSEEQPKKTEKKAEPVKKTPEKKVDTKTPEKKTDNKTPTKKTFASSSSSDSDSESEAKPAKKTPEKKVDTKTPEKKTDNKTPTKTESAKKKKQESSSSSSSSDSESEDEKPKTPAKDESSKKRKRDAESENSEHSAKKQKTGSQPTTPKTPFKRIDPEKVRIEGQDPRLFNNSYLAKGGEDYGLKADKDLRNLHGDRFRHEKTKKKKGSYKGGQLSMTVNSVMFSASESDSE